MEIPQTRKKIILIFIIGILLGGIFGFSFGVESSINTCVRIAASFLQRLGLDYDRMKSLIEQYIIFYENKDLLK